MWLSLLAISASGDTWTTSLTSYFLYPSFQPQSPLAFQSFGINFVLVFLPTGIYFSGQIWVKCWHQGTLVAYAHRWVMWPGGRMVTWALWGKRGRASSGCFLGYPPSLRRAAFLWRSLTAVVNLVMVPRCPSIQLRNWGWFWLVVPADDDDGTAGLTEGGGSEWVCVFHPLHFPPLDDSIAPHDRWQRRGLIFLFLLFFLVPDDFRPFQVCHSINPNI